MNRGDVRIWVQQKMDLFVANEKEAILGQRLWTLSGVFFPQAPKPFLEKELFQRQIKKKKRKEHLLPGLRSFTAHKKKNVRVCWFVWLPRLILEKKWEQSAEWGHVQREPPSFDGRHVIEDQMDSIAMAATTPHTPPPDTTDIIEWVHNSLTAGMTPDSMEIDGSYRLDQGLLIPGTT